MILNLCSLAFNLNIDGGGATPAWGTEMGQGEGYKFAFEDMDEFFTGMVYNAIPDIEAVTCPLGKGGNQREDYDFVIASLFRKVFVNGERVPGARFLALIVKKINGDYHVGRRSLKYNPRMTYHQEYINQDCYDKIANTLGISYNAAWFVHEIVIRNQDELHFSAIVVDGNYPKVYHSNNERKVHLESLLPKGDSKKRLLRSIAKTDPSPRQIIFYGAPGTGKSHRIKEQLGNLNVARENIFRTTFHPDSDYSTFVGAYKPTKGKKPLYGLNGSNTVRLHDGKDLEEEIITYQFVAQAFLKAYIRAYEVPEENVYLVIEEINRGNCAQIFGDLFQLLDRDKDGKSDYTIKADDDLRKFLEEKFEELGIGNDGIADGELCLPGNLFIYATMNTSDQSLFPIDSAFKRRWDWEYEPIKYDHDLKIVIGDKYYKWTSFQKQVNKRIKDATSSEDKMLGDYFVNPSDGVIDEKTLRNKVLFYLWNDVCKDGEGDIFKEDENKDLTFSDLYGEEGTEKLIRMMKYLEVEKFVEKTQNAPAGSGVLQYVIDENGDVARKTQLVVDVMDKYLQHFPKKSVEEIIDDWNALQIKSVYPAIIQTEAEYAKRTDNYKEKVQAYERDGERFYLSKEGWRSDNTRDLVSKVNNAGWGITLAEIVKS